MSANNGAIVAVMGEEGETVVMNGSAPPGATGAAATHTASQEADARIRTLEAQLPQIDRETMRLAMIMPENDAAMQLRAAHGQQQSVLAAVLAAESGGDQSGASLSLPATEAKIQRVMAVAMAGGQHMEAAAAACQAHVSGVARRGTLG